MSDSDDPSSGSNAPSRRQADAPRQRPPQSAPPDGTSSTEQPDYGPEEVHSVLTPAGEIESVGRFYRGLGPRWTKALLFGTLSFILVVGLLNEIR